MSRTRVIGIGFAVAAAAAAFMISKSFMGKPGTEVVEINKVPTTEVLVAAKDLQMGEKFGPGTLVWKPWPKDNLSPTMITHDARPAAKEDLEKARARVAIYEGETINDKKLIAPENPGFMSAILPKGMRAISVGISENTGAGGFILPNDRVDVILTRKFDNPPSTEKLVVSETVLTNVKVLAINQVFRQETGEDGDKVTVAEGKTATLELDSRQTEIVSMVQSAGEISLALRSIAENDGKKVEEIVPEVASAFNPGGKRRGSDETLIVRYGVEKYTSNR
jgi:pilus assembly protein CpaB